MDALKGTSDILHFVISSSKREYTTLNFDFLMIIYSRIECEPFFDSKYKLRIFKIWHNPISSEWFERKIPFEWLQFFFFFVIQLLSLYSILVLTLSSHVSTMEYNFFVLTSYCSFIMICIYIVLTSVYTESLFTNLYKTQIFFISLI